MSNVCFSYLFLRFPGYGELVEFGVRMFLVYCISFAYFSLIMSLGMRFLLLGGWIFLLVTWVIAG
jgi:hypothetical protein